MRRQRPLPGRVAVVTGASAGIGRATAIGFARQGWHVALLARGEDGLEGARREVEALGTSALPIVTDVAEYEQVEAAAIRIQRELGPIDVWVNNAMATLFAPLDEISPADFERATRVTYLGSVWGTMAALKRMKARNAGTIVQVGSALAYRSIPLQSAYCGAKSAIRGFVDSIRCELIHENSDVHITMVHLAAFNTPQFEWGRTTMPRRPQPVPPIYQPEIAADAIVWAAQRRRREVWVGFSTMQAIVGTRLFPGLLDRMLARRAWDGQMTGEPLPAQRMDNLYQPVPGDAGAYGRSASRARNTSWHYRLVRHRSSLLAATAIAAFGGAAWWTARRSRRPAGGAPGPMD